MAVGFTQQLELVGLLRHESVRFGSEQYEDPLSAVIHTKVPLQSEFDSQELLPHWFDVWVVVGVAVTGVVGVGVDVGSVQQLLLLGSLEHWSLLSGSAQYRSPSSVSVQIRDPLQSPSTLQGEYPHEYSGESEGVGLGVMVGVVLGAGFGLIETIH